MIRGTTPTFTLTINDPNDELDLTACDNVYVTIKQYDTEITKETDDLEIEARVVSAWLDQDESLDMVAGTPAAVQVNWTYTDTDGNIRRGATKVKSVTVDRQLLTEVLE